MRTDLGRDGERNLITADEARGRPRLAAHPDRTHPVLLDPPAPVLEPGWTYTPTNAPARAHTHPNLTILNDTGRLIVAALVLKNEQRNALAAFRLDLPPTGVVARTQPLPLFDDAHSFMIHTSTQGPVPAAPRIGLPADPEQPLDPDARTPHPLGLSILGAIDQTTDPNAPDRRRATTAGIGFPLPNAPHFLRLLDPGATFEPY